ncbi:MAG: DUF3617 domain-containing protein [Caulobacteraceae bacterium]
MRLAAISGMTSVGIVVMVVGVAHVQPLPRQRVGLWRSDMVTAGQHASSQMCVDAASQAQGSVFGSDFRKNRKCQNHLTHNADGSWTEIATCQSPRGGMQTSRTDVSGDFSSKYEMTLRSPPNAAPLVRMSMTWVGPCKAGQRGGDMIVNGKTYNITDH